MISSSSDTGKSVGLRSRLCFWFRLRKARLSVHTLLCVISIKIQNIKEVKANGDAMNQELRLSFR